MRTAVQETFLRIIRLELAGTPLPDDFTIEDEPALVSLAEQHDLAHLLYDGLRKAEPGTGSHAGEAAWYRALWRVEQLEDEVRRIRAALEDAEVPFLFLKGSVIRSLYPENWMRTSSDVDVLVRETDLASAERALEERVGYIRNSDHFHQVSYTSEDSGMTVELHRSLWVDDGSFQDIVKPLGRVWTYARPVSEGAYEHVLSDDLFYYYHLAHMAKHFSRGGCGVRPLLDLWLLNRLPDRDVPGRRALLREGGLESFEASMVRISEAWMDGRACTEDDVEEQYIFEGGVVRNDAQSLSAGVGKSGGRFRYLVSRIFPSPTRLSYHYPIVGKYPVLTPVYWVVRAFDIVTQRRKTDLGPYKNRVDKAVHEMGGVLTLEKEEIIKEEAMMRKLGLKR
ncbi:MAG: nucleotidyltransferase family protein [Lachnospiraceae bacterium]|nr:nucleotidyltransferase family protein [Lachnospiraceae bacterium]